MTAAKIAITHGRDVSDASVVIVARRTRDPIFTTEIEDLARLDPSATLIKV